jgi:hypothetical protein
MGRPPIGKKAMTDTERQRRRRERLAADKPATPANTAEVLGELLRLRERLAAVAKPVKTATPADSAELTQLREQIKKLQEKLKEERAHRKAIAAIAGKAMEDDLYKLIVKWLHPDAKDNTEARLRALQRFNEWARGHVPGQMKKPKARDPRARGKASG